MLVNHIRIGNAPACVRNEKCMEHMCSTTLPESDDFVQSVMECYRKAFPEHEVTYVVGGCTSDPWWTSPEGIHWHDDNYDWRGAEAR